MWLQPETGARYASIEQAVSAHCRDFLRRSMYGECKASCELHETNCKSTLAACTKHYVDENPDDVAKRLGLVYIDLGEAANATQLALLRDHIMQARARRSEADRAFRIAIADLQNMGIQADAEGTKLGYQSLLDAVDAFTRKEIDDVSFVMDDIMRLLQEKTEQEECEEDAGD